jgi:hypothetical protein
MPTSVTGNPFAVGAGSGADPSMLVSTAVTRGDFTGPSLLQVADENGLMYRDVPNTIGRIVITQLLPHAIAGILRRAYQARCPELPNPELRNRTVS